MDLLSVAECPSRLSARSNPENDNMKQRVPGSFSRGIAIGNLLIRSSYTICPKSTSPQQSMVMQLAGNKIWPMGSCVSYYIQQMLGSRPQTLVMHRS